MTNEEIIIEALNYYKQNSDSQSQINEIIDNIIAFKIWTKTDLKKCLDDTSFSTNDKNVNTIVNEELINKLKEKNANDWDCIYDEIFKLKSCLD